MDPPLTGGSTWAGLFTASCGQLRCHAVPLQETRQRPLGCTGSANLTYHRNRAVSGANSLPGPIRSRGVALARSGRWNGIPPAILELTADKRLDGCMVSRPQVCRAAGIAKVPLITARRPAVRRAPETELEQNGDRTDRGILRALRAAIATGRSVVAQAP